MTRYWILDCATSKSFVYKLLTQFARYDIAAGMQRHIRAFLSVTPPPVTIADVMGQVTSDKPQAVIIPILHMAFHHELLVLVLETEGS